MDFIIDDSHQVMMDILGIIDFVNQKNFGKERGSNPKPNEYQINAIEKLNQKLLSKPPLKLTSSHQKRDEEETVNFDIKSKARVILFEGKVLKRSLNSLVAHTSKRHAILLNDVLLITSVQNVGNIPGLLDILKSGEKLTLHQYFNLEDIALVDCTSISPDEDPCSFQILTDERAYHFTAESESDKRIWLEEIRDATFCLLKSKSDKNIGWFHEVVRGTLHSSAMHDELELVGYHLESLQSDNVDIPDESLMMPIHWAALFGRLKCLTLLLQSGADIDCLNGGLNSPLMLAAARGHEDVVSFLVDNGANVHLTNTNNLNCLAMAVLYGSRATGISSILNTFHVRGMEFDEINYSGASLLHECALHNIASPIKLLVDLGADVNIKHEKTTLTPLQVACSIYNPDPETVRSFLDRGAAPNWRDPSKKSSFDIVLSIHQDKRSKGYKGKMVTITNESENEAPKRLDSSDFVSEFAQVSLPVLMEICKKGGRFTENILDSLRPSFKEAIQTARNAWLNIQEPEKYLEYIQSKISDSTFISPIWTEDKASKICLLCAENFTLSIRRHHCRLCGILCCDLCSSKKLYIKPLLGMATTVLTTKNEKERITLKIKKEQDKADSLKSKDSPTKNLFDSNINSPTEKSKVESITGDTMKVMNDTMKVLTERGDKIQELANKGEEIREGANDFNRMTKLLLQKTKMKNAKYGGY